MGNSPRVLNPHSSIVQLRDVCQLVKAVIPCARKGQMLFCGKKTHSDSTKKFSETDIINMLEFLIDSIIVIFVGRVFQQTVGIPMGTNCEPLLADVFFIRMRQTSYRGFSRKTKRS